MVIGVQSCTIKDENFLLAGQGYTIFAQEEFSLVEGDTGPYLLPVIFQGQDHETFVIRASVTFKEDAFRSLVTFPANPDGDFILTQMPEGQNISVFQGLDLKDDNIVQPDRQVTIKIIDASGFGIGLPVSQGQSSITLNLQEDDFSNLIGQTSFEETGVSNTDRFYKDFDATADPVAHDLKNKEGFNIVDFIPAAGNSEMAFDSSWEPTKQSDGTLSNNFKEVSVIGAVQSLVHEVAANTGTNTYAFNNTYGRILVDFGTYDLTSKGRTNFSFYTFFKKGEFSVSDGVFVIFENEAGQAKTMVELRGTSLDTSPRNGLLNDLRGRWIKHSTRIPNEKGRICLALSSSQSEQFVFIDDVRIVSEFK